MKKDDRKRFVVALNLDDKTRETLERIAEEESRSPTQQIEYWLKEKLRAIESDLISKKVKKP